MKLPGGALLVAITISFVLSLICGSMLMLAYYAKINTITQQQYRKASRNLQSAMIVAPAFATEQGMWKDLYGEGTDSVWMQKKRWGIYEVVCVKAHSGLRELSSTALCGQAPEQKELALMIPGQLNAVKVTGNTRIKGLCMVPRAGLDEVSINGQSFYGNIPAKEDIKESQEFMKIDDDIIAYFKDPLVKHTLRRTLPTLRSDSIYSVSYSDTLVMYKGGEVLNLENIQIKGCMLLTADSLIVVNRGCVLSQVMLMAPRILFRSGFQGSLQAFASDSLVVQEQCRLDFPSALVLVSNGNNKHPSFVKIKNGAEVSGSILCLSSSGAGNQVPRIILEENSKVHGEVLCTGFTEPKGQIYGSLQSTKLICTQGIPQENLLMGAEIDGTKRSEYFAGAVLKKENKKSKVISWLP